MSIVSMYKEAEKGNFLKPFLKNNIRKYLGKTGVNNKISATLKDKNYFDFLNNGITLLCDAIEIDSETNILFISLVNPKIINGL